MEHSKTSQIEVFYIGPLPNVNVKYTISRNSRKMVLHPKYRSAVNFAIQQIFPQLLEKRELLPSLTDTFHCSLKFEVSKIASNPKKSKKSIDIDNFLKPMIDIITQLIGFDDKLVSEIQSRRLDPVSVEAVENLIEQYRIKMIDKKIAQKISTHLHNYDVFKKLLIPNIEKNGRLTKLLAQRSVKNITSLGIPLILSHHKNLITESFPLYNIKPKSQNYFLKIYISFKIL